MTTPAMPLVEISHVNKWSYYYDDDDDDHYYLLLPLPLLLQGVFC